MTGSKSRLQFETAVTK